MAGRPSGQPLWVRVGSGRRGRGKEGRVKCKRELIGGEYDERRIRVGTQGTEAGIRWGGEGMRCIGRVAREKKNFSRLNAADPPQL